MNKLKLYPMTAVFLTFFIGSCVFAYISGLVKLVLLLFFAVMLILLLLIPNFLVDIFRDKSLRRVLSLILGALITSLTVSFVTYDIFSERIDGHSGEDDTVTLKVISCDYSLSYVSQYIAKVEDSENGIPYGTRIILRSPIGSLEEGDILSGKIMYSSLKEESSTSFDGRRYYLPKRIFIVAEDVSLVPCGNKFSFSITGMFDKLSSRLSSMILASVGRERGGIASAVLLGDKDYLDDSVVRDFRRIGI